MLRNKSWPDKPAKDNYPEHLTLRLRFAFYLVFARLSSHMTGGQMYCFFLPSVFKHNQAAMFVFVRLAIRAIKNFSFLFFFTNNFLFASMSLIESHAVAYWE